MNKNFKCFVMILNLFNYKIFNKECIIIKINNILKLKKIRQKIIKNSKKKLKKNQQIKLK